MHVFVCLQNVDVFPDFWLLRVVVHLDGDQHGPLPEYPSLHECAAGEQARQEAPRRVLGL